jgi:hypothetical protein
VDTAATDDRAAPTLAPGRVVAVGAPGGVATPGAADDGGTGPLEGATSATAPNLAGSFCPATHESNCCWLTVNTLKRIFAWDAPQYSTQNPFHTLLEIEVSGVYHIQFVRFVTTSRFPPSCGVQNEWITSADRNLKFTVRPTGR